MIDPYAALAAMLQPGSLQQTLYPATSRYHGIATSRLVSADGKEHVYLQRRFVPLPERVPARGEHAVCEGDRLDLLAARFLGDPGMFWRICDANVAMRPDALEARIGQRLRIPEPAGSTGALP
jgi:hypothetical protein